ncbi:MAG: D-alanyl-D-alanine carboxypeptidase family protein [Alkalispirochaeta sp.]
MIRRRSFPFGTHTLIVAGLIAGMPLYAQTVTVSRMNTPGDPHTHLGVDPPGLEYAQAAALLEVETDTVLFEMRGGEPWPPASLTKLVTIYTALNAAEEGRFDLDRAVAVSPSAYASAVPPGSSLMFLGPDQMVNGKDLLRGLAISSGNDAAVEVALRVSGSVEEFLSEMNEVVRQLGYHSFHFEDAAGLSPANRATAVGLARFARDLVHRWPWLTEEVFNLEEFTYPQIRHYPSGGGGGAIRQFNRNGLVGSIDGVDGLKTGFIEESGYNIAVTVERNGTRLIAVVLGVEGSTHSEGGARRESDAQRLLEWGFAGYENTELAVPAADPITLWGADRRRVTPAAELPELVTIPRGRAPAISGTIEQPRDMWAPIAEGQAVGTIRYTLEGTVFHELPLTVEHAVSEGNLFRRAFDRVRWWLRELFGSRDAA